MEALDVPLDALVKKSKISGRGGRRGRGRGGAGGGRIQNRAATAAGNFLGPRTSGLFRKGSRFRTGFGGITKPNRGVPLWQQQFDEGARLYVSNLDNGVSNEDIKELFSHIGELKHCSIHYDKMGRSKGTAEVCFSRKDRALLAISQYNNVQLDGKPMVIDMIGGSPQAAAAFVAPAVPRVQRTFPVLANRGNVAPRRGRGGGSVRGRGRGRGRGGRGGGRSNATPKSLEELNAELDKYHSQAMDTA